MFREDCTHLAQICAALGVRKAVIAPGSRNTPLTLALTAHNSIACYPVTDERSAAFFALGMAQYSGEPVVLVCTSGSAVLNFAPAVAEAYYQNLPLIVITADRPPEWIDQSDGQTIRQPNIFANYCKASFQLPVDASTDPALQFSDRMVTQAIDTSLQFPRGPVHINFPLNEPLYVEMPTDVPPPRIFRTLPTESVPAADTVGAFTASWNKAAKRMIVAGTGCGDATLNQLLSKLAENTETLVVAENISNVSGRGIVSTPDLFFSSLTDAEKKAFRPDMLITIGHSVVSKQLKSYLRTCQPAEHWQLQTELPYADTYKSLTHIVPVKAEALLTLVASERASSTEFRSLCSTVSSRSRALSTVYLNKLPHCDIALFRDLLPLIPAGWVVQLANSTPVRISQFFDTRSDLRYYCNRGTSGIEGSVATAAGSAIASQLPTLLISGDLSFLYDSNGLWNANFPPNLKIVVLNNDGANIFSMIGDQNLIERCRPFFHASHSVNLEALCKAFGIEYRSYVEDQSVVTSAQNEIINLGKIENNIAQDSAGKDAFVDLLSGFLALPGAAVLEVKTDREVNVRTYKQLFKTLQ